MDSHRPEMVVPSGRIHRCCMAVVSSCREMLGSVPQRAQPLRLVRKSSRTATINVEEGGDDVKSARPLRPGRHTRYNGWDNELPTREGELISANPSSVQIGGCNPPP